MEAVDLDDVRVVLDETTRLAMSGILAGMMFTVALSLKLDDFKALQNQPLRILGGVMAQVFGLPLLTFMLVFVLNPTASIALGMFVVASCPGGNMSNILTHFARGNTAYSVSLTAISSVTAAILTPVSILFWSNLYRPTADLVELLDIDPWMFLIQTAALLAIPMLIGMIVSAKLPIFAEKLRRILTPLSILTLMAIIVAGVVGNWNIVLTVGALVIPIAVLHNASALGLGAITGRVLKLDTGRRRSLTFEVGIQNAGLGLIILLDQFDGVGGATALTAIWSIWHLIAGGALVGIFRYIDLSRNRKMALGKTS
ncbi:MAG: bile acid:sodium symporter family protein [Maricaulis sp.]|nr:bile acid:sodium symporter family protein [Maricaulis sp.]